MARSFVSRLTNMDQKKKSSFSGYVWLWESKTVKLSESHFVFCSGCLCFFNRFYGFAVFQHVAVFWTTLRPLHPLHHCQEPAKCSTLVLHLVIVEFVRAVFLQQKNERPQPTTLDQGRKKTPEFWVRSRPTLVSLHQAAMVRTNRLVFIILIFLFWTSELEKMSKRHRDVQFLPHFFSEFYLQVKTNKKTQEALIFSCQLGHVFIFLVGRFLTGGKNRLKHLNMIWSFAMRGLQGWIKFNNSPLKISHPKGKDHLPTIIFQRGASC